jgi:hypothetical protein
MEIEIAKNIETDIFIQPLNFYKLITERNGSEKRNAIEGNKN